MVAAVHGMTMMTRVERTTQAQTPGALRRRQKYDSSTQAPKGMLTVSTMFTIERKSPISHAESAPRASRPSRRASSAQDWPPGSA